MDAPYEGNKMNINSATGQLISLREIRALHPNTSIGPNTDLVALGYPLLEPVARPETTDGQIARKGDPEEYAPGQWRETWVIEDATPTNNVPQRITALQGMLAIKAAGLVEAFITWKAGLDPIKDFEVIAFLDKAEYWDYNNPIIDTALAALGAAEQKDALFISAASK